MKILTNSNMSIILSPDIRNPGRGRDGNDPFQLQRSFEELHTSEEEHGPPLSIQCSQTEAGKDHARSKEGSGDDAVCVCVHVCVCVGGGGELGK